MRPVKGLPTVAGSRSAWGETGPGETGTLPAEFTTEAALADPPAVVKTINKQLNYDDDIPKAEEEDDDIPEEEGGDWTMKKTKTDDEYWGDWGSSEDEGGEEDEPEQTFSFVTPPPSFICPVSIAAVVVVDCNDDVAFATFEQLSATLTKEANVIIGAVGEALAIRTWDYYGALSENHQVKVYALDKAYSPVQNMNIVVELGCAHGFDLVQCFRIGTSKACVPRNVTTFGEFEKHLHWAEIVLCEDDSVTTWAWLWAAGVVEGIPIWGGRFCLVARAILRCILKPCRIKKTSFWGIISTCFGIILKLLYSLFILRP